MIYVYDLNFPMVLKTFYTKAKEKGKSIERVKDFQNINENAENKIIIQAIPLMHREHWEGIKKYIAEKKYSKIFIMAPSIPQKNIEDTIGINENIEYLLTHDNLTKGNSWIKRLDNLLE